MQKWNDMAETAQDQNTKEKQHKAVKKVEEPEFS